MKVAQFHEYGSSEVLKHESVPDPEPGPGEVIIRVHACGLNHLDLDLRNGTSRIPLLLPFVSGLEIAGEVESLGRGVSEVQPGDRVMPTFYVPCGLCEFCRARRENICANVQMFGVTRPGGYAELVAAPADSLLRIPEGLSYDQAAATQVAFGTAFHMLITRANIKSGETVLIQGAGSGIGSAAIQIAVQAGLRVIATAGSPEKLDKARALGAELGINTRTQDFVEEVMDHTNGRGVDIVYEHIGGEVFSNSLRCLATGGRLVTCGAHAGEAPEIDIIELFRREASVIGSYTATLFEVRQVLMLVELGRLQPVVHGTFPLSRAGDAQSLLERREQFGKVLLHPQEA